MDFDHYPNGRGSKNYLLSMNQVFDAEACLWKPTTGNFRVFTSKEVNEILKNKKITIIGDSEARNMYTTLVTWAKNDYFFNSDMIEPEHTLFPLIW